MHWLMYRMFIDDERNPPIGDWVVVRSSDQAIKFVQENGPPAFISFDHDLGGDDTTMVFLKKLVDIWDDTDLIPDYQVHSANPVGSKNIVAFMESWKRSIEIKN